jgi:hypothetical protein
MRHKKEEKLYLANFEFISGEYEQPFQKIFYAKNEKQVAKKIHEYFVDYYGEGNTFEIYDDVYYYWYGEIAVRKRGWAEIKNFDQLLNNHL